MPTFDWQLSDAEAGGSEIQWQTLARRYASAAGAEGTEEWAGFVFALRALMQRPLTRETEVQIRSTLQTLVDELSPKSPPRSPTLFVSHQRDDRRWAEWVAWAGTEAHFDYWLDLHDPALTLVNSSTLPPTVKSVLVAGIIEMALLNCTHIVSLQTVNAQKSRWVPYEFGRAKERRLLAQNAASWFENSVGPNANGDYLQLGYCAATSADLRVWLNAAGRVPPPRPNLRWKPPLPGPLPN